MFTLHDVWARAGIEPKDINVILHSPFGELGRVLPQLIRTRPRLLEVYQATHSAPAEHVLKKGRRFAAAFLKVGSAREQGVSNLIFVGLYENQGWRVRTIEDVGRDPDVMALQEGYGIFGKDDSASREGHYNWFDLAITDRLEDLQGRLMIDVRLTPSYVRLAEKLDAPVSAIHEIATFEAPAPGWRDMIVSAGQMRALPVSWEAALRHWRGVYLIVDEADGARYVGSAYGVENLLSRWRTHVAREDRGVTAQLSKRPTGQFRFSILELLAPSAPLEEVIAVEQSWKQRLHTVTWGLNEN